MLNAIWIAMLVAAVVCGALTGQLEAVTQASVDSAKSAVELAIGLVGVMTLWIGLMQVLQEGGLLRSIARGLRPVMTRLFPDVPADHPAMSMMVLNMTSNMLGLGNAATPFGLKAMMELDRLNDRPGTATNAMALFLAINTSNIAILPLGMIALRSSLGSRDAGSIVIPTILATGFSTVVAIIVAKFLSRLPIFAPKDDAVVERAESKDVETQEAQSIVEREAPGATAVTIWAVRATVVLLVGVLSYAAWQKWGELAVSGGRSVGTAFELFKVLSGQWLLVLLIVAIALFGAARGVKVYDAVVEGGKEGFGVALRIIPFLVAILVAVGMLRASGAIDLLVASLSPVTSLVGMPAEALPMALLRTLSGSGAYGVSAEIMQTHGPDSLIGTIVSTMQGSTETTFYVLALYFGVVSVRSTRHTLLACLIADTAGALGAVWAVHLFF